MIYMVFLQETKMLIISILKSWIIHDFTKNYDCQKTIANSQFNSNLLKYEIPYEILFFWIPF